MNRPLLKNILYCQNKDVAEYKDIFFETNLGIFKNNLTSIDIQENINLKGFDRLVELDEFKEKYGELFIDEIRITYDNNMYLLISQKIFLAIEYVPNSYFEHSVQEFRIIEDIYDLNKNEFDDFKELDIIKFPT
jgi:hypothetical protein